ncbi:ester cyclase [Lichenihabitans psoromatis]|uniref:ester cyclase n=1 Tax=Lichenihabitans psoromatis TaxID=2528642 RepID=UPI0014790168|nr:ester cyclase [Lichenihabitans psoromatis]
MVTDLSTLYRSYIACLNQRDWSRLGEFVHEDVIHNGNSLGVAGYRRMLERDVAEIPDLVFHVEMLVSEAPYVASRLIFDCRPVGTFLGLQVNGRRVRFAEHATYAFRAGRIREVWSLIDKAAIEAQLAP